MRYRNSKGVALAEFIFTFPVFIILVLTGFELLRLSYNYIAVQIAATYGVRIVNPCPCNTAGCTGDTVRANIAINKLQTYSHNLGLDNAILCITQQSNVNNCLTAGWTTAPGVSSVGKPRELFLVRIRKQVPLVFGMTNAVVDAVAVGRHEPPSDLADGVADPVCD